MFFGAQYGQDGSRSNRGLPHMVLFAARLQTGPDVLIYNHMVVRQRVSEQGLNQIFRALADGTRRDILERSLTETPTVSGLAARYDMSFAAVQKHVAVLERAGLIQKRANGREQLVSTNRARLKRASELLDRFEVIWRQRMAQLDDVLQPKGK